MDVIHEMINEFIRLTARNPSWIVVGQGIADRMQLLSHPNIERIKEGSKPYAIYGVPLLFISSDVLEVASDDLHVQLNYLLQLEARSRNGFGGHQRPG